MPSPTPIRAPARMKDHNLIEAAFQQYIDRCASDGRPDLATYEHFANLEVGVDVATLRRWRKQETTMSRRRRQWFVAYLAPSTVTA